MNAWQHQARSIGWLIENDLRREWRAPRALPAMLLVGAVLVLLIAAQLDLPAAQRPSIAAGLYWLTVFFAGTMTLERSFASEADDGCWQALRLYPLSSASVFLAKLIVNCVALFALEAVLAVALTIFAGAPLVSDPGRFAALAVPATLGYASLGTLLSALTAGLAQRGRGGLLALLVLPLASPVVLAAAEATRVLLHDESLDGWWRCVQLLCLFAVMFTTLGLMLFEPLTEE